MYIRYTGATVEIVSYSQISERELIGNYPQHEQFQERLVPFLDLLKTKASAAIFNLYISYAIWPTN